MNRLRLFLLLVLCVAVSLVGCKNSSDEITSIEQLNDSRYIVGANLGEGAVGKIRTLLPNAQLREFNDLFAGYMSVAEGKITAFAYDKRQMEEALEGGLTGVRLLDEVLGEPTEIAIGISPKTSIPNLKEKIDAFIEEVSEDGTMADMERRWVNEESDEMPEIEAPENPTTHLVVGTSGIVPPYSYYKGSELVGYDIEMSYRLAKYLNASVEIKVYNYNGLFAAAQTGSIDCILANLNVTPERAEAIPFSNPIFLMNTGVMVREEAEKGGSGFLGSIADSFNKTFIRESRYKLFVSGIGMTLAISVLSILFGTILGFVVYVLCRRGNRIANGVTKVSIWLIQGMPMVVLLMVLFYVVFAKVPIGGMWVAIVGFTLTFGAAMFGMLKSGVSAVDRGQTEAAYALGFKDSRTFFEVVLPQAILHFLPEYKAQVVSLVKATSIVGYIAVSDLTKVADIIRSRTFDAFFPLFAVSVIYFILAGAMTFIIGRLMQRIDPRKRPRDHILKEVEK